MFDRSAERLFKPRKVADAPPEVVNVYFKFRLSRAETIVHFIDLYEELISLE